MNKLIITGNLTRDPERTETSSGIAICRFSIAVNRNYKNNEGEYITDFFNCIAWRGLAETIYKYTKKGNKIAVIGSIENRSYEDSNGNKRTVTEVLAQEVEFLTAKPAENNGTNEQSASKKKGAQTQLLPADDFYDDSDCPF